MSEELEYLNKLIADGIEYPDAEYKTVRKFNLKDADELRAEYDEQER